MFIDGMDNLNHLKRAMLRLSMVLDSLSFMTDALVGVEENTVYGVFGMLHDSIGEAYDDLDRYALEKGE